MCYDFAGLQDNWLLAKVSLDGVIRLELDLATLMLVC